MSHSDEEVLIDIKKELFMCQDAVETDDIAILELHAKNIVDLVAKLKDRTLLNTELSIEQLTLLQVLSFGVLAGFKETYSDLD